MVYPSKYTFQFKTKEEVDLVLEKLLEIVSQYGFARVTDLNDMIGLPSLPAEYNQGWVILTGVEVKTARVEKSSIILGYILELPQPVSIYKHFFAEEETAMPASDEQIKLIDRIENDLTLHPPVAEGVGARMDILRDSAKAFAYQVVQQGHVPSREVSLALMKIEEALFYAIASIARNQENLD